MDTISGCENGWTSILIWLSIEVDVLTHEDDSIMRYDSGLCGFSGRKDILDDLKQAMDSRVKIYPTHVQEEV